MGVGFTCVEADQKSAGLTTTQDQLWMVSQSQYAPEK